MRSLVARYDRGAVVLGEEGGTAGSSQEAARIRYVVDPIDGTRTFENGGQGWAVSIAIEEAGTVVAAAVYHPGGTHPRAAASQWPGTMYAATLGGGAFINGRRFRMPAAEDASLKRAVLQFGLTPDPEVQRLQMQRVTAVLPEVADLARGGSAALGVIAGAQGQVLFCEGPLNDWDVAASRLFAEEAGAAVAMRPLNYRRNGFPTCEIAVGRQSTLLEFNELLSHIPPFFGHTSFSDEQISTPDATLASGRTDGALLL